MGGNINHKLAGAKNVLHKDQLLALANKLVCRRRPALSLMPCRFNAKRYQQKIIQITLRNEVVYKPA